jgi:regulator of chromosome condensation
VVCADNFSAALTRDGHVYAWGSFRDPNGIIGFNKSERQFQRFPQRIAAFGEERVILLGSGENHVFAVTADDTLWAFGANDENQLGRRVLIDGEGIFTIDISGDNFDDLI